MRTMRLESAFTNYLLTCATLGIHTKNIKIDEKRGRKDRYSSISYGNYVASKLEMDLLMEGRKEDDIDVWSEYLGFL